MTRVDRGTGFASPPPTRSATQPREKVVQNPDDFYYNLDPDSEREAEPTEFFFVNCLLNSRLDSGNPSNERQEDEDVNVYLTHLLSSFVQPDTRQGSVPFLIPPDHEIARDARDTGDPRLKYNLYKSNADNILLALGIFRNENLKRPSGSDIYLASRECTLGRGKAYYRYAQTYSEALHKRATGISLVLEKLSRDLETYVEILNFVRDRYFHYLERLGEGSLFHIERSIEIEMERREIAEIKDEFLDVFAEYKRNPSLEGRRRLIGLAEEIRLRDPDFDFPEESIDA